MTNYTSREYGLAMQIVHLQDALDQANKNAKERGMLGVLPQHGSPSFRNAKKFHKRVREILKDI